MNQWQQDAARLGGPALVQLLSVVRDNQLDLMSNFDELRKKTSELDEANKRLLSGFPANDVEVHRCYHESITAWRELRNKMVREALMKVTQAGTLAAFGWLALTLSATCIRIL